MVIATRFIPLPPLSVVSTMVSLERSQWFGTNIVVTGQKDPRKAWICVLATAI